MSAFRTIDDETKADETAKLIEEANEKAKKDAKEEKFMQLLKKPQPVYCTTNKIYALILCWIISIIICWWLASELTNCSTDVEVGNLSPSSAYLIPEKPLLQRLSSNTRPLSYSLYFEVPTNKADCHFRGQTDIHIAVVNPVSQIKIHSRRLNITGLSVINSINSTITSAFTLDAENSFLIIELRQKLVKDERYTIKISYSGEYSTDHNGFSRYPFLDGKTVRYVAYTKLQPTNARTLFPCYDEPEYKAYFSVRIFHSSDTVALSNMPRTGRQASGVGIISSFARSPYMSTYLVAMTVGGLRSKKSAVNDKITLYAAPGVVEYGTYAVEFGVKVLAYFEGMFGVNYDLPKLDMVAITDYGGGAMENWGLMIFRERYLLLSPTSTSKERIRVAQIVAHEIAHMWFGNLLTCKWWNDTWLNEGFATYWAYRAIIALKQSHHEDVKRLMWRDTALSSENAQSLVIGVVKHSEIRQSFNRITYYKGGAFLNMVRNILGEDKFMQLTRTYVKKYLYKSVTTQMFLEEVSEVSNQSVVKHLMSWLYIKDYPVVTASDGSNGIEVTQKPFLKVETNKNTSWGIYMNIVSNNNQKQSVVFNTSDMTMSLDNLFQNSTAWIMLDNNLNGLYRVRYTGALKASIVKAICANDRSMSDSNAAAFIQDEFAFAQQNADFKQALAVAKCVDFNYLTWRAVTDSVFYLRSKFLQTPTEQSIMKFMNKLLTPRYMPMVRNVKQWAPNTTKNTNLQHNILSSQFYGGFLYYACYFNVEACKLEAQNQFIAWVESDGKSMPHPDLRRTVYRYGFEMDPSYENFKKMWKRYLSTPMQGEKLEIAVALAYSPSPSHIQELLNNLLDERYTVAAELSYIVSKISRTALGYIIVPRWLGKHKEALSLRLSFENIVESIYWYVNSQAERDEAAMNMKIFFNWSNAQIDTALDRVTANVKFVKAYKEPLERDLELYISETSRSF